MFCIVFCFNFTKIFPTFHIEFIVQNLSCLFFYCFTFACSHLIKFDQLVCQAANSLLFHLYLGNYSRLVCEIEFVRSMGYYLIQIYIPASLIVIISWVSFWLHRVSFSAGEQYPLCSLIWQ